MVQLNIGDGWGDKKQELFNTHHALGAVGGIEPNRSFHPWPPPAAVAAAVGAPASDWLPPAFFFLLLLLPPLLPGVGLALPLCCLGDWGVLGTALRSLGALVR
jgi:hypothetical protein